MKNLFKNLYIIFEILVFNVLLISIFVYRVMILLSNTQKNDI